MKHAWCSKAYKKVAHFVIHVFSSTTGVPVLSKSEEAEKAGIKISNDDKKESSQRRQRGE